MIKRSLSLYFIYISVATAILVLFSGLFISMIGNTSLVDRFYQKKSFASTQLFLQMMDQVIPGQLVEQKKVNPADFLLRTVFGIQLSDPYTIIASELPALPNTEREPAITTVHDEVLVDVEQSAPTSLLSENAPVLSYHNKSYPSVFIYHTHSRESWITDVGKDNNDQSAFHDKHNITLVGKHFADQLSKIGIPVHYNNTDHDQILLEKDMKRAMAYVVSADTVVNALQRNPEIDYIFDFHRDAVDRKYTTVNINGEDYAKIMFVIGKQNKQWEENLAFAEKIQKILDEKYPGLCRPITEYEPGKGNNGEYNQSLSSNALTVEIGGIHNTLEESNRTVELLAHAFAEVYLEAVPVFAHKEGELK